MNRRFLFCNMLPSLVLAITARRGGGGRLLARGACAGAMMNRHPALFVMVILLAVTCCAHAAADDYPAPTAIVVSADGSTLWVACRNSRRVLGVNSANGSIKAVIETPGKPSDLVLASDGATLYVACPSSRSRVAIVDTAEGKVVETIAVGHTAEAIALSPDGKTLYAANRFDNDISVVDLTARRQTARAPVVREPVDLAVTPDGLTVVVVNHQSTDRSDMFSVVSVVTLVDIASLRTTHIELPNGSTGMRGVAISPDGRYAYVTHVLGNFQLVPSNVGGGWTNQNVLSVFDLANRTRLDTVFLDDLNEGAGNPWGIAIGSDGHSLCVAHAGSRELSVIDAHGLIHELNHDSRSALMGGSPYNPGVAERLRRRIPLRGVGARAVAVHGRRAYVVGYFSDTLDVVDLAEPGTVNLFPLTSSKNRMSQRRRGEMLFHDAAICYQRWQSCSSCHPDARADGLNWDLLNDGAGNAKNTRSMLLAHATPPSMSTGIRPTAEAAVRSGIEHTLFQSVPEDDAAAIDAYLKSLRPVPSPHLVDGLLGPSAQRGRETFHDVGCAKCHPAPLYTDLRKHNVDSRSDRDMSDTFDTPTLIEVWRTAPYLHDGRYTTIRKLLVDGRHGDAPQSRIDDLVEFVLSL